MNILATNKSASFDYELLDKYEAGLVLTGAEVKSIKTGHISLKGSFVTLHSGELYLTNANISPYPFAKSSAAYEPTRSRKLLVRKIEIRHLIGKLQVKGLTLVPLRVYTKKRSTRYISQASLSTNTKFSAAGNKTSNSNRRSEMDGLIKLEFALAKGKKAYDKRKDISKKESKRKIERALKNA